MNKFRVWLLDMMWYNDTIVDAGDKQRNLMLTMDGEVRICDWKDGNVAMHSPAFFHLEAVVMQYTGLLDKSGKEIYEGDIVETTDPGGEYLPNMEVGNKGILEGDYNCFGDGAEIALIEWAESDGFEFKIVGNIHESPELLK